MPNELAEPQNPTSPVPPVSVTTTLPGRTCSATGMLGTSPYHTPWAPTTSSTVSSFHIGRLEGTRRWVTATPQNFIPSHRGRTAGSISPMSK